MFDKYFEKEFSWSLVVETIYGKINQDYFITPDLGEKLLEHLGICMHKHYKSENQLLNDGLGKKSEVVDIYLFRQFLSKISRIKNEEIEKIYQFLKDKKKNCITKDKVISIY